MKSIDPGVLSNSSCFSFTPSQTAKKFYFYLIWCGHYFCTQKYFIKRDFFPYILLVYVRKGELILEYKEHCYTAGKGNVVLIDCQEPHYYRASNGLEFLYIHFDGVNSHDLCQYIMNQRGIVFQGKNIVTIGELLYQIVKGYEGGKVLSSSEISLIIYEMLCTLTIKINQDNTQCSPVNTAVNYIRNNVGRKILLEDLASITNLSTYYFSHIFKTETGYSPIEYVISTRLDTAKVLLKTTSFSIEEIAFRVGYKNTGSFINLFIQKVGCSPKQFRKTHI
ncbi:MAG: AraC family transcriptional regulator [Clostridium sp.]|jgi:AraC-like DNA-binding protein|uniref:AraC family transcriptional regulator n=1 Tax=Clostridium sp. TaxID=1506 RepID=UPI0025C08454|nr:AraC family transcriptional regulator [Clostridium sp.]MCH3965796.1 AraC family transcriptional regulator [Clostridium sp.]MCI1717312.1 AraC family transcriptional regulator [Clostridium sp.]MCI1801652.1 AraC family transcriptional regulator [Clostridium sp.]MCI1815498.1 AraC family transcriptional regulator [Clostridium sp.]MCI1872403.1 AraC family transcriptional regulator [Clostridium sp.]